MKLHKPILILFLCAVLNLLAHDYNSARPDSHAPINVMGEHTHNADEWMLSYRYSYMEMSGLMHGDSSVTKASGFMKSPRDMEMHMQMIGAMYAPTDKWTAMLMFMHHDKSMDSVANMGGGVTSNSAEGWGDTRVSGLYKILETTDSKIHLNLGLSLPSGSIDEKGSGTTRLGYPMQLGSGTWDLLPGITYLKQSENWSWGAQGIATIRLDENKHNYTLGDRFDANLWAQKPMNDHLSLSARIHSAIWENVEGKDTGMMAANMMPTVREDMQKGFITCLGFGANYTLGNGHRLAFEFVKPVYQNYGGYQMEREWMITLGWQYSW